MTIDEFLEQLGETPRVGWAIEEYGRIRFCVDDDPMTVVATNRPPVWEWIATGRNLGLDSEDSRQIVMATDNSRGHDPDIRARILEAVGLLADAQLEGGSG